MHRLKKVVLILSITQAFFNTSQAQLPDGSIAPNFVLTDLEGQTHDLYAYLDQGKTVYIDFFACHCPYCWNYHNTHALADLHKQYGPGTVTDDVLVLAIELDANNGTNEFYGISGDTQGDWVTGSGHPFINPEGSALTEIVASYQVNYYPLIYAICPDRTITVIGKKTTEVLYAHVGTCSPVAGILDHRSSEVSFTASFAFDKHLQITSENLDLNACQLTVLDLNGRLIARQQLFDSVTSINAWTWDQGIYFIRIETAQGQVLTQKIALTD